MAQNEEFDAQKTGEGQVVIKQKPLKRYDDYNIPTNKSNITTKRI